MNDKTLNVQFEKIVDTYQFEKIITLYHYKSKISENRIIIFDFFNVEYVGLLELSQIALWIAHLINIKKNVSFKLPKNKILFNFLYNYEFINFLIDKNIISSTEKYKYQYTPEFGAMFPMKFQDNQQFLELLSELKVPGRSSLKFNAIKENELVKNNVIYSIILQEIGDNVFIHSKTQLANIIVTKHVEAKRKKYTRIEDNFLKRNSNFPLVEIVISDYGVGFYNKLKKTYENDEILPDIEKSNDPSHNDIIQYAFLKHTTSRSDAERKEFLVNSINSKTLNFPYPTGLYKVKNIVRQYKGAIYIRSGKGIVFIDYSSNDSIEIISTNLHDKKLKRLTNFPGVQIRLYFPIKEDIGEYRDFYPSYPRSSFSTRYNIFTSINLNDYFDGSKNENEKEYVDNLQNLLDLIEKLKLKYRNVFGGIIINANDFKYVNNKGVRHLIISSLMSSQTQNFSYIIVNISKKNIEDISNDYNDANFNKYYLSTLIYDHKFSPHIIGINSLLKFSDIKLKYIEDSNFQKNLKTSQQNIHIINFENGIEINFDKFELIKEYIKHFNRQFSKKFTDSTNNIYSADTKVLVPNKYYCEGFFELSNIADNVAMVDDICHWIALKLQLIRPDNIVSVGPYVTKYIKEIYRQFEDQQIKLHAALHSIDTENIYFSTYNIQSKLLKGQSVLVLCDVIGSGDTLAEIIANFSDIEIKSILCLVNAKPKEKKIRTPFKIPIESLVQLNIDIFYRMPKHWDYTDVKIFDKTTNRIIISSTPPKGPLLYELSKQKVKDDDSEFEILTNPFLEMISTLNNSYFKGHFLSRENHILYFFNIIELINTYSKNISTCISNYLIEQDKKMRSKKLDAQDSQNYVLLFPDFNPGMNLLAEAIAKEIPRLEIIPVSSIDLDKGLHYKYDFTGKKVILIDDAFITGTTIERMIDRASERKAKYIFTFSLIKRGNSYQGRKFENLRMYGNTQVHSRYLIDAELPIYSESDCPLCKKKNEYVNIIGKFDENKIAAPFKLYISNIINNLSGNSIHSETFGDDQVIKYSDTSDIIKQNAEISSFDKHYFSTLNLRWKLEVAIDDVRMRKNIAEIFRRKLKYKLTTLKIIRILSDEKYHFIDNKYVFEKLFYPKFQNSLIETCKYFLENSNDLDSYDLLCTLDLINIFDKIYFINNLKNLILLNIDSKNNFFAVITAIFLSSSITENQLKLMQILKETQNEINNKELNSLLNYIITNIDEAHKSFIHANDTSLESYRESFLIIHNIRHFLDGIIHYLHNENYNSELLVSYFNTFIEAKSNLFNKLDIFFENDTHSEVFNRYNATSNKIENFLNQFSCDLESNRINKQNSHNYLPLIESVEILLCQSSNDNSLPVILESFAVDIQKVCYEVRQQEQSSFRKKGIYCDYFFPNNVSPVFGKESDVILIFKNIMENVHIHSNGNLLAIIATISSNYNCLEIQFIDNGNKGFSNDFQEGLLNVERSIKSCKGHFSIAYHDNILLPPNFETPFDQIQFGTVAKITIPLVYNHTLRGNKHEENYHH